MYHTQIPYTPKYKPVITFIGRNVISADDLPDHDSIDDITLVRNTTQENSPELFLPLNCLGFLIKEGTETANNNTQSVRDKLLQ